MISNCGSLLQHSCYGFMNIPKKKLLHVNLPSVHSETKERRKSPGYCHRGLRFGGQQTHRRHGILVISLVYLSDDNDQNIGHIGKIEENIGKYKASSKI